MIQPFVPIYFYSIQNPRKHGDDGKVDSPLPDALSVAGSIFFSVFSCKKMQIIMENDQDAKYFGKLGVWLLGWT